MDLLAAGADAVRRFLDGEDDRTVDHMPRPRYDDRRPKATYRADVTQAGQVVVPAAERDQGAWPDIEPGDDYHVHCFPPALQDERVGANRYVWFDATVTADNYLTVPAHLRDDHDIRPGDTVAMHLYWSGTTVDG